MDDSNTPAEAAPHAERAINHITGMDEDIENARINLLLGEDIPTKYFSEVQLSRALELCIVAMKETGRVE